MILDRRKINILKGNSDIDDKEKQIIDAVEACLKLE